MKLAIILLSVFLFSISASLETPVKTAASLKAASLDEHQLHTAIVEATDSQDYAEAVQLLEVLKQRYPNRYVMFPYTLLHARTLALSGDYTRAQEAYKSVRVDSRIARFAHLPLARLAVIQGKPDEAIRSYAEYLDDSKNPDYNAVATEALDYAILQNRPAEAIELAGRISKVPSALRLARFYTAKAHAARKDFSTAKSLYLKLLDTSHRDDIASLTLTDLDRLEENRLTEEERIRRAKIAHQVWNFELVKRYLTGLATTSIENSYYYGRALSFMGDYEGAKKAFQTAAGLWPDDPMSRVVLFQYAGASLRHGDYSRAEQIYRELLTKSGDLGESATIKLVETLRAQSRYAEAIKMLDAPASKRSSQKQRFGFAKARVYFQMQKYSDALTELNHLLSGRSAANRRELLLWKGVVLKRMGENDDARAVFRSVSSVFDYFGLLALEQLEQLGSVPEERVPIIVEDFALLQLPDQTLEARILELADAGDLLPSFLYLHLYEEASPLLNTISSETWTLLGVDSKNARRRLLALAQLAGLSGVYSSANYYSEVLLKGLPSSGSGFAFSEEILKVLFPLPYNKEIERFSRERNIDPLLVLSIMKQESKFKRYAKSQAFARGLMQLIPSTATQIAADLNLADFSVDQLYQPEVNINLGTRYVQNMMGHFGDRLEVLAASYNGGEGNVRRWLACTSTDEPIEFFSNIDLPETRTYVMKVRMNYEWYKRVYGKPARLETSSAR